MALKMKKDVKKSSYYVWFLGAQESRGLRGDEYALPAIEHLERRSRDLEPFKVTLQVSQKGLKIVQNVVPKGKPQTIKHFIPHNSITSAVVQGDVVACVLLLYNPVTHCPIHVHAYRCDSDRTAEILCSHLRALIDKPENQRKFADIERKLLNKGALPLTKKQVPDSSLGSEVSTRESESSNEERCVANLYDSLAAELKQKLSTAKGPILLPPRDYDTVHRQKGNLSGIDTRRCLNQSIVGVNARRALESSGGSSGIGSDLAPSPDQNDYHAQHDNQSTSEEDWNESTAYMMHEGFDVTPPRRVPSPLPPRREQRYQPEPRHQPESRYHQPESRHLPEPRHQPEPRHHYPSRQEPPSKYAEDPGYSSRRYSSRGRSTSPQHEPLRQSKSSDRIRETKLETPIRKIEIPRNGFKKNTSESSLKMLDGSTSPKDRFNVAKEKFMNLERQRMHEELEQHIQLRRNISSNSKSSLSLNDNSKRRSSQKWDDEEVVPERRADLPRVSNPNPNPSAKQAYRERDHYYDERFDNRHAADRYDTRYEHRESPPDYRYEERRRVEPKKRIEAVIEKDIIEPVFDDRYRHVELKRTSRADAYETNDEWRNPKRAVSRSRLLKDANGNRHSMYEHGQYDNNRRAYVDIETSSRRFPEESYDPRYNKQDRYREVNDRERYDLEREPPKIRHSYAEPIIRSRVGMAPVRPY